MADIERPQHAIHGGAGYHNQNHHNPQSTRDNWNMARDEQSSFNISVHSHVAVSNSRPRFTDDLNDLEASNVTADTGHERQALSYGTVPVSGPGGRGYYMHVDNHIPWHAVHRMQWARRRRVACFCDALFSIVQLFILLGLLCAALVGVLLAWEHRRELWDATKSLASHLVEIAKSILHQSGREHRAYMKQR
jgi:hypothetical protein